MLSKPLPLQSVEDSVLFKADREASENMPKATYSKLVQQDYAITDHKLSHNGPSLAFRICKLAFYLLLLLNIVLSALLYRAFSHTGCRGQLVYCMYSSCFIHGSFLSHNPTAPYNGNVQHERRRLFRDIEANDFAGPPRPEHDSAWRKIIERTPVRPHCNIFY